MIRRAIAALLLTGALAVAGMSTAAAAENEVIEPKDSSQGNPFGGGVSEHTGPGAYVEDPPRPPVEEYIAPPQPRPEAPTVDNPETGCDSSVPGVVCPGEETLDESDEARSGTVLQGVGNTFVALLTTLGVLLGCAAIYAFGRWLHQVTHPSPGE